MTKGGVDREAFEEYMDFLFSDASEREHIYIQPVGSDGRTHKGIFRRPSVVRTVSLPRDHHIYVGMYTYKDGIGEKHAALTTGVVWADWDNVKNLQEVQERIRKAGWPHPSMIVSSGRGYHAYWRLEERTDKDVTPILKAIQETTGSDEMVATKAGKLRAVGTVNHKPDVGRPVKVVSNYSDRTFKIQELARIAGVKSLDKHAMTAEEAKAFSVFGQCNKSCVVRASEGATQGYRSFAMGKVVAWLKSRGMGRVEAYMIASLANAGNNPPMDKTVFNDTFNKLWDGPYKFDGCRFTNAEMQRKNDHICSAGECVYHSRHSVQICMAEEADKFVLDNLFFRYKDVYSTISANALAAYMTLLWVGEAASMKRLAELMQRNENSRAFKRIIEELEGFQYKGVRLIEVKRRGNTRNTTMLKAIPAADKNYRRGYTLVGIHYAKYYLLGEINATEFKFMLLLKHNAYKAKPFLVGYMAEHIGVDESRLWVAAKKLEKLNYIERHHETDGRGISITTFKLKV